MARDLGHFEYAPNKIYRLKVLAIHADIDEEELYDDYEEARHDYETWKYDQRVMDAHGCVSLVEMSTNPMSEDKPNKFIVTRELGNHQW
ncbi:hypothetical protein E4T81_12420 [Barnesiella sp. WM24]|uniref:hypothetical protein n=1 Tax=Barnesiella sp. WM24 TaxID=2558278 RepID=UPI001072C76F|nr:hypothetical protein [Barnesiella sp. WM24]TFU92387.1 hypothetical protein E4T81_12420 [Barnesiella sp. WM24]